MFAHGIADGQVFVDGNKRTALVAMLTILDINGWSVNADDFTLASWVLDLSRGLSPEDLAARLGGVSDPSGAVGRECSSMRIAAKSQNSVISTLPWRREGDSNVRGL